MWSSAWLSFLSIKFLQSTNYLCRMVFKRQMHKESWKLVSLIQPWTHRRLRLFCDMTFVYSLVRLGKEGENPAIFSCTGSRVSLEERIDRTWKVLTHIRFMTLGWSYTKLAARSPMWYTWNESLLYDICLRVDVSEINSCLNILFICWFLCVFYPMTFVLRNTDPTQRDGICSFANIKKSYWNLCSILRCSVRIICILTRCVFWSPVRHYLQIFLSLYWANREISNIRFVYKFWLAIYSVGT